MMADRAQSHPTMPLAMAAPGEIVELVEIRLTGDEKQRLQELGLVPGSSIRVIKSDFTQGLILAVRQDARLAINRSIAHKLMVSIKG